MNPLLYFDLLSPKKDITLGNEYSSYRTQLGALFSIVAIIITLINTKDVYQTYANMEVPKETVDYSLESSKYVYKTKEFPLLFGYFSADLQPSLKIRVVKRKLLSNLEISLSHFVNGDALKSEGAYTQAYERLKICNITELEIMIDEYKKSYPEQYKYEKKYWKRYLKFAQDSFCINDTDLYLNSGLDDNYLGKLISVGFHKENKILTNYIVLKEKKP